MANSMTPQRAITGTHGECWVDGIKMAEAYGLDAQIEINKIDVPVCGWKNGTGQKMVGWNGTGSIKFNKVSSTFIKRQLDAVKSGKQLVSSVISKLADPSVAEFGHERIQFKGVTFDTIGFSWEAGNVVQGELPFTFDDFDLLDVIKD